MTVTAEKSTDVDRRPPRARPAGADQRRAAHLELPALAVRLRRARLLRGAVAGFPGGGAAAGAGRLPVARAAVRPHRSAGGVARPRMNERNKNLAARVVSALLLFPLLVWITWLGGLPFTVLLALAAAVAALELTAMFTPGRGP